MQAKSKIDEVLEKQEEQKKAILDFEKNLKFSCAKVFATKEGQYVARYIKDLCGFTDVCNDVNPNVNIYKNSRRDVYINLRKFIPSSSLIKIEIKE